MKHDENVHSSSAAFFFFVIFSSFSPPYHDLLYENLILVVGYCVEKKFFRFNDTDCYPKHFVRKIVNPSKLNKKMDGIRLLYVNHSFVRFSILNPKPLEFACCPFLILNTL